MRARKLAVAFDDAPPPDEASEIYPDEEPAGDEAGEEPVGRICIACGDAAGEGCEHREVARLDAPSRAVAEALSRLRRAAAEQRAAVRALRVLVLTEVARGRGDIATTPEKVPTPCPRCAIRDAEVAAAAPPAQEKAVRKRGKGGEGQQALPFLR
jgi:hypothetical protein